MRVYEGQQDPRGSRRVREEFGGSRSVWKSLGGSSGVQVHEGL